MNVVLERWNALDTDKAAQAILPCCGSLAWAKEMTERRSFADADEMCVASGAVWWGLAEADWREAFNSHPRIGEFHSQSEATTESLLLSADEQRLAARADEKAKRWLYESNRQYEAKFGRIFIVCASGRTAAEILATLEARMGNDPVTELREAAEQQWQITQLRLRRWLAGA